MPTQGINQLTSPITEVVGAKTADLFEKELGISSVGDLLRHYPRRYEQRGALTDLSSLEIGDHVTVQAQVRSFKNLRNKSKPGTRQEIVISDGTGQLTLMFFNQHWREKDLVVGRQGLFSGQISVFNNKRQLTHPDYELLDENSALNNSPIKTEDYVEVLLPIYPATSKVQTWTIERAISAALAKLADVPDPIEPEFKQAHQLIDLDQALRLIHHPANQIELDRAIERLKWDEALVLQILLAKEKHELEMWPAIPRLTKAGGLLESFDAALPFRLTTGQTEVAKTIETEMAAGHPMHRLLQGEVGSGKTVVALRAMLTVVDSGGQAALLAPTEVLANQHYRAITKLLGPLAERGKLGAHDEGTGVTLLTGSLNTAARRQALLDITTGQAGIVIGTHALLEDRVDFFDLGLVVIDEQHRFGVEQRATLVAKAGSERKPHVLVMTATPIPRTVAMTAFGALDISTLTELPAGRSPITTHVVLASEKPTHLARVWDRIVEEVASGYQAYIVVPRIASQEDKVSDKHSRPAIALEDLAPVLIEGPLSSVRVGVLHGQMAGLDKDDAMQLFTRGPAAPDGLDVLISTTVIEVGVDVPNATMMVIMDADRFGISQLHQLRGRVGRGQAPGLCILVTEAPPFSKARERLAAVAATTDGFELAALDLEQRGEGDVLGRAQSGLRSGLKLVSVLKDEAILTEARKVAIEIVAKDPDLVKHNTLKLTLDNLIASAQAEYVKKS
jgi:ATP-dependent DNA helicase RecG